MYVGVEEWVKGGASGSQVSGLERATRLQFADQLPASVWSEGMSIGDAPSLLQAIIIPISRRGYVPRASEASSCGGHALQMTMRNQPRLGVAQAD